MSTIDGPAPVEAYGTPAVPLRNGPGTAALVLGILAIVLSWTVVGGIVLGILAVVFGFVGRGRVKRGEADNRRGTNAGIITGIVAIILAGGLIALGVSVLNSPARKTLQQCVKNAHGDKAAISQCNAQYVNSH
jgi:heme/copper-type cytochrome/quinol oxidase subunit 2